MIVKLLSFSSIFLSSLSFGQSVDLIFEYDEAGNQIFRGTINSLGNKTITSSSESQMQTTPAVSLRNTESSHNMTEEQFWSQIRIYPVPVKDILTIDWNDRLDDLIDSVSLYEQASVHWKFQRKNIPILNKQIEIDMSQYYLGIYILQFTLKDGRVFSRNIIKQ